MIHFTKTQPYWLEHPAYGTFEAKLTNISTSGKCVGFKLGNAIGPKCRGPICGITFGKFLPLFNEDGVLKDIFTGSIWKIFTLEPPHNTNTRQKNE